ncbi:MAG: FAD:protein transferase [Patescibacteria group bacterium]|nr:FAD:protein transferase [Patescibacteria group bacterium]
MVKLKFKALGTIWNINYSSKTNNYNKIILDAVKQFESDYSRFISNSYISQLNSGKIIKNPKKELIQMLQFAKKAYINTDGCFDVSVGGFLEQNGYGNYSNITTNNSLPYYNFINNGKSSISIDNKKIHIDFGGFGKGWLIDKIANIFGNNVPDHVINGGGDIYVKSKVKQKIYLEHPSAINTYIGYTLINNKALAVSSNQKRTWQNNNKTYSHILNPSNKDINNLQSLVTAPTANLADMLATTLLIANIATIKNLQKIYKFDYLIIKNNGTFTKSKDFNFDTL